MPYRLVVLDGFSLLFRAFFGLPTLTTSYGLPTNAVYGFATTLLRFLDKPDTDALVAAFDSPARTFRHDVDPRYKANRPPLPDDLGPQIPIAFELMDVLGIPVVTAPGFEADDVIGAIACSAATAGWNVNILTSDSDLCQLVDDRISILYPPRKGMDLVVLDESAVVERYGVNPKQIPDWKALAGDHSDNIPGVAGIGPKTATALLQQFGSLDAIYDHLDDVKGARLRQQLALHRESATLSRQLATLCTDLPFAVDPETWRTRPPNRQKAQDLFARLEFRSLLDRIPGAGAAMRAEVKKERNYGLITARDLPSFLERFRENRPVAIHWYETGDVLPMLGVSPAPGIARTLLPNEVCRVWQYLEDSHEPKCFHDAKAAINRLHPAGITLRGLVADTALSSYLLNPARWRHHLEEVSFECLGLEFQEPEAQPSLFGPEELGTAAGDTAALDWGGLLCQKADCIGQVHDVLQVRLEREQMREVLDELELPLVPILAEMERCGVLVDVARLKSLSSDLAARISRLENEIYGIAGCNFCIASTQQLQDVLYGKLRLPHGKVTKTGYSTDAETLKLLSVQHPLPAHVLAYRELAKLRSTYTEALPRMVRLETGRVHTSLNQTIAATGRLSSSDPNLQNIPIRTSVGREIRKAFIASPGYILLSIDYSQVELRILAHVTQDSTLLQAFRNGDDVHARTAAALFGVAQSEVTPEMRRRAKSVNFGLMYGMSAFGLAADLAISRTEADAYIKSYLEQFPGVRAYVAAAVEGAQRRGYVETLLGRRRYLPDINNRNRARRQVAERAAINSPIQGTAADIMKRAMIEVYRALPGVTVSGRMILQVHDELVFEVPSGDVESVLPVVTDAMERAMRLDAPLVADATVGVNWGEMTAVRRGAAQPFMSAISRALAA